jgi:hypothetical protein
LKNLVKTQRPRTYLSPGSLGTEDLER